MGILKGFTGKLLIVNLTNQKIFEELLDEEIAKDFLGGAGYCCRYLYDHLEKDTDPLSPNNTLMFMTGPFCGSTIPTSGRFVICAKSPYTGIWGESNCGSWFGADYKNFVRLNFGCPRERLIIGLDRMKVSLQKR